jgi:hypothetical protein
MMYVNERRLKMGNGKSLSTFNHSYYYTHFDSALAVDLRMVGRRLQWRLLACNRYGHYSLAIGHWPFVFVLLKN